MTTREEMETLIARGRYEEVLERLEEIEDPLERVRLLLDLALAVGGKKGLEDWIPDLVEDALYIAERLKNPSYRGIAYAMIGSTLGSLGYDEDAMELFARALDSTDDVVSPLERGMVLSTIAYHMTVGGYPREALEIFNVAFDTVMGAEVRYTQKVDGILRIGELLEAAGDELPAGESLEFYGMAFDIFDKLHVNQRAGVVEKKIQLAGTVRDVGLPEIRRALLEGRHHQAIVLVERKYDGFAALVGELEVALWMKRTNSLEYPDIVDRAFERYGGSTLTEAGVRKVAKLLTELGRLKMALRFAITIKDPTARSEALGAIAMELARKELFEEAKKVVGKIPDPAIRERILMELAGMEGSR
ncbi:hypothetical protein [Thermococcus sp.]|uniref:hypothetical protein n=1 Tax=Thermococcus sp. TaxID=35749 RepID=UPI0026398D4B|nr:hypothetical protein [Thermococcus sp.]